MYLIVGLGNPGSQYERTRHNIGFALLDLLAVELATGFSSSKWQAETAKGTLEGNSVLLAKPQTFMNLSGDSVSSLVSYFKIPVEKIIVVHDDLDLACGQIKLAVNRGHGGHNGLKSINARLGSSSYNRLRFGIGRPKARIPIERYVLSPFASDEEDTVGSSLDISLQALHLLVADGMAKAMQEIHSL